MRHFAIVQISAVTCGSDKGVPWDIFYSKGVANTMRGVEWGAGVVVMVMG